MYRDILRTIYAFILESVLWVDQDIFGIISSFVCEFFLDYALIDVGPSYDWGVFPLMKIRGYASNMMDVSSFFTSVYSTLQVFAFLLMILKLVS